MAAIPKPLHSLVSEIYRWRERTTDDGLRPHLGASLIGHVCDLYLWNTFRWVSKPNFDGRMLRLFSTGQREEARMIEELRGIGAEVSDTDANGNQWRVDRFGGHFGGSMDAVGRKIPGGSEKNWEVIEFKTHNEKSFKDLQSKGVKDAKPQHYAQMQVYMYLTGMERANYLAANKNTDDLHYERIHADPAEGERLVSRAERIVFAAEPPIGISQDPAWFECKYCNFNKQCHSDSAPLVNCRTCAHSTPEPDGTWSCAIHGPAIPMDAQVAGCDKHRYIPALLRGWADLEDASNEKVTYRLKLNGKRFINGDAPQYFTSQEIYNCQDKVMLTDGSVAQIRGVFDARVAA